MRKAKTRGIALILFAVMLFSAAAGIVPARAERVTEIEKALAEGGDKALWELVNTSYSRDIYRPRDRLSCVSGRRTARLFRSGTPWTASR